MSKDLTSRLKGAISKALQTEKPTDRAGEPNIVYYQLCLLSQAISARQSHVTIVRRNGKEEVVQMEDIESGKVPFYIEQGGFSPMGKTAHYLSPEGDVTRKRTFDQRVFITGYEKPELPEQTGTGYTLGELARAQRDLREQQKGHSKR